jgi:uncharacterized protein YndB with AHSA1/START domain
MTRAYHPGPAGGASVTRDGDRFTLVMVRELRHPPERVWRALTDPAELAAWAPFDADRDLGRAGPAALVMAGAGGGERSEIEVLRAEAPTLLEHTWGDDVLRWELEAVPAGTRLTLRHTMGDRDWLSPVAAGWHMCVEVMERALDGEPVGRIAGPEAKAHGWERVEAEYAALLGVPEENHKDTKDTKSGSGPS